MASRITALLFLWIIIMISGAGCTTQHAGPVDHSPAPSVPLQTIPATPASPLHDTGCTLHAGCVPGACCHPSRCVPLAQAPACDDIMCTASCEGPLDCGAGNCGCVDGKCSIISSIQEPAGTAGSTSLTLAASPRRYTAVMSSTPGIGIEPVPSGFSAKNATFTWNTTCGVFLSWNHSDFRITELGESTTNRGEKLYWSFRDFPSSPGEPVTITVTATEPGSGRVLGCSTVILDWEDTPWVNVRESV